MTCISSLSSFRGIVPSLSKSESRVLLERERGLGNFSAMRKSASYGGIFRLPISRRHLNFK